jgi:DNA adenine methylase
MMHRCRSTCSREDRTIRYLGGKSRIGKEIAAVIAPRGIWWEPFMGGANVTPHLAAFGPGIASDAHPALMAMYQAVKDGWEPPTEVSKEQWQAAKTLPDSDPLKAFCGFGLSYAGKWFGGYTGNVDRIAHGKPCKDRPAAHLSRLLSGKLRPVLLSVTLSCFSFLAAVPEPGIETLYCDPPYEGTTGYGQDFDHPLFWQRCQQWSALGSRVFVSEYSCPVAHEVVWQKVHALYAGSLSDRDKKTRTEKLFLVKA